jgi:hypothetical protein
MKLMKKPNRPEYFIIEATTGVMDGFYTYKQDAAGVAEDLSDIWIGSKWLVCELIGYCGVDGRTHKGIFYNEDYGINLIEQTFKKKDKQ